MLSLHQFGKDAIPLLIESLDDSTAFDAIQLVDPRSSFIPPDAFKPSYIGVLYAYTIELILGKKSLRQSTGSSGALIDSEDCVFKYGLLKQGGESLSKKDLPGLKLAYQNWWASHKGISLDELRKEWVENKRPLAGSSYKWL